MASRKVIVLTGCDSGLGWATAARCAREGFVAVAGLHQGTSTEAAAALKALRAHVHQLEVTKHNSVLEFRDFVGQLLQQNPSYKLHAVVNNAGTMIVGEFEWLTPAMIEYTVQVNMLGAMRVAHAFLPDLRRAAIRDEGSKPRILNVASHCALQPLPHFSVYSGTKAGLIAWTKALRMELHSYGVTAVAYLPGGFVGSSNIMSGQLNATEEMLGYLDEEQKTFHESRIRATSEYLSRVSNVKSYDSMKDIKIVDRLCEALLVPSPKPIYITEPLRYKFYYNLFKLPLPEFFHRWLIRKFLNFPFLQ